jgi:hypothetical protein
MLFNNFTILLPWRGNAFIAGKKYQTHEGVKGGTPEKKMYCKNFIQKKRRSK